MSKQIVSVIVALRVVLADAEKDRSLFFAVRRVNIWIARLPGAWYGRWRHLRLKPTYVDTVDRPIAIAHLRATIAYLESCIEPADIQPPERMQPAATEVPALAPPEPQTPVGERPRFAYRLRTLVKRSTSSLH